MCHQPNGTSLVSLAIAMLYRILFLIMMDRILVWCPKETMTCHRRRVTKPAYGDLHHMSTAYGHYHSAESCEK